MTGDLEHELTVPALVQQLIRWQATDGKATQDKWARAKTEVLLPLVPFQLDEFDTVDLTARLFRDPNGALKFTVRE
jgi:hypothetical protein